MISTSSIAARRWCHEHGRVLVGKVAVVAGSSRVGSVVMVPFADTVPLGGLLASGLVLGLFGMVGWICRRRPQVRDRKALALANGHVEVTEAASADAAEGTAAWLRRQGIEAFADAEEVPPKPRSAQMIEIFGAEAVFLERRYRCFVVVGVEDLDRARQLLGIVPQSADRRRRGQRR